VGYFEDGANEGLTLALVQVRAGDNQRESFAMRLHHDFYVLFRKDAVQLTAPAPKKAAPPKPPRARAPSRVAAAKPPPKRRSAPADMSISSPFSDYNSGATKPRRSDGLKPSSCSGRSGKLACARYAIKKEFGIEAFHTDITVSPSSRTSTYAPEGTKVLRIFMVDPTGSMKQGCMVLSAGGARSERACQAARTHPEYGSVAFVKINVPRAGSYLLNPTVDGGQRPIHVFAY
jgi:hypothetical protein